MMKQTCGRSERRPSVCLRRSTVLPWVASVALISTDLALAFTSPVMSPSLSKCFQSDAAKNANSKSVTGKFGGKSSLARLFSSVEKDEKDNISGQDSLQEVTGVTLKMAFDSSPVWGVADLSETKSERFTSPDSLDMVHRLRRESSAVLVGRGTVERDDCSLSVRRVDLRDGQDQPTRVILDPSLKIMGGDFAVLSDGLNTLIYHVQNEGSSDEDVTTVVVNDSVKLVGLQNSSENSGDAKCSLSPTQILNDLSSRGLHHIMVEGGPATARAFLDAGAVDRAILVRAPLKFEIPVPAGMNEETMKMADLKKIGSTEMGGDTVEYWTRDGLPWPNPDLSSWP